jgi:hypothetical protein
VRNLVPRSEKRTIIGVYGDRELKERKNRRTKLLNEQLHNLHSSCNIVREIKLKKRIWVKHEDMKYAYNILVGKFQGKLPFGAQT